MNGINDNLNSLVNKEVSAKKAFVVAKKICEVRRPITRRSIEDILAAKELNKSLALSI